MIAPLVQLSFINPLQLSVNFERWFVKRWFLFPELELVWWMIDIGSHTLFKSDKPLQFLVVDPLVIKVERGSFSKEK